jgi:GMP synthase-like glutamine amidotransferase
VSDEAVAYFKLLGTWDQLETTTSPPSIDMMFVHGDYVVPLGVPPGLTSMGGTPLSPHNGFFNGTNILTFQGHAEFDVESVEVCIEKLSEKGILPKRLPPGATLQQVKETLGGRVDAQWIALTALRFFQNKNPN